MCGTMIVGQMSPGDTSEKICKTIGSREHERMNISTSMSASGESRGLSFSRETVPLYSPTELASRLGPTKDGKGVTLLVFTGGDAHEIFYPFPVSQKVREAHVPAHWTLGPPASDATPWSQQSDAAVARGDEALGDASIEAAAPIDAVASPPSDASYMQELERLAGEAF